MRVISVQSRSGGTGVTLTAAELAIDHALIGKAVLAVDLCPHRSLSNILREEKFSHVEDCRQMFRPMSEARWDREPLPLRGLLSYPDARIIDTGRDAQGQTRMFFRQLEQTGGRAAIHVREAITFFSSFYDVMVIDVCNKDAPQMAIFTDLSDEIHLLWRDLFGNNTPRQDWLDYIDRAGPRPSAKLLLKPDRNGEVMDRNWAQWVKERGRDLSVQSSVQDA